MWLERLRLSAFRAFAEAEVIFGPTGLTLIAGANNAGKSTILTAIDALLRSYPPPPIVNTAHPGPAAVEATFVVDDDLRGRILTGAAPERIDGQAFRRLRVTLEALGDGKVAWRQFAANLDDGNWAVFGAMHGDDSDGRLEAADLGRWAREAAIGGPFAMTDRASGGSMTERLRGETGLFGPVARALRDWAASVHHFGAVRGNSARARQSHGFPRLMPTGENLVDVMLLHSSRQSPEWMRVREVMADLVPEVGTPLTPVEDANAAVTFTDSTGVARNLQDLGTGVQQLLLMTVAGETHVADGPLLVEEPETSLHPGAQRALLRHLERWAETRQVIATTHSATMLDLAGDAAAIWLVERSGAVSTIRRVPRDRRLLDGLGVRLSDVFAAERLLVVEGPSDVAVFEAWWGPELRAARAQVVSAGGGDASRRADWYAAVTNAGHALVRSVLFVRDRDELDDEAVAALQDRGQVHVLDVREVENYFIVAPDVIAAALSEVATDGQVAGSEVAGELEAMAPSFKPVVIVRRVVGRLAAIHALTWQQMSALSDSPDLGTLRSYVERNLDDARTALRELDETWTAETDCVTERWGADWMDLAPGGELLGQLWASHGARYDKRRDGARIAAAMDPPASLGERVRAFLADQPLGR